MKYNTFLRPINELDRNIKILDDNSNIKYTIEPFSILNVSTSNNILNIYLKSEKIIYISFSTPSESKEALKLIQEQIDILTGKVPLLLDKDVKNYVDSKFIPNGTIDIDYIIDKIGYIPENEDNKAIDFTSINNTLYPTTMAVDSFLKENLYTFSQSIPDNLTYDIISNSLGYVPENILNKVTTITPSNNEYPTSQAVIDYVSENATDRLNYLELSINEISEFTYFIEETYNELKSLKDSSLLIPGKLYILTDYQHKYYIENTNTSNKKTYKTVSGIVSSYIILNNN